VLGVLIFAHELGHFLVAKVVGIQVLRFSLGSAACDRLEARRDGILDLLDPAGRLREEAGLEEEGMVGELEGGKADATIDPADRSTVSHRRTGWPSSSPGVSMNVLLHSHLFGSRRGRRRVPGLP